MVSKGPSSRGFALLYVLPPPPLSCALGPRPQFLWLFWVYTAVLGFSARGPIFPKAPVTKTRSQDQLRIKNQPSYVHLCGPISPGEPDLFARTSTYFISQEFGISKPVVCTLESRGFRRFCGFRDFREPSTQLLVCSCLSCLRRFRDFRRFRERRPTLKPWV